MRDFRQLQVWRKAHVLAIELYRATDALPGAERFGLTRQLRRSAVSISSNIAEGCGRSSDRQLAHFLDVSAGSASELEYQLQLALDLGFILPAAHAHLTERTVEVRRMLAGFLAHLRNPSRRGPREPTGPPP